MTSPTNAYTVPSVSISTVRTGVRWGQARSDALWLALGSGLHNRI